ncbi:hypothetical protein DH2020_044033 [Rehmannia glutinosa]|uniref:Tf2-1-like SH3-like domain-containing protein n=1 Tax=Rehmannia glutinosa TaxID=99300 RepID=A0ABR0UI13_REHGL
MAPYEALYGRKCRSPLHWEIDDQWTPKVDLVQEAMEKVKLIKERICTAQSRQKSYADKRIKDLEFEVGDEVFLETLTTERIDQSRKKRKTETKIYGPFEILAPVGDLAYRLALPPQLAYVHNVFHVSMLRKYVYDPSHIINYLGLEINRDLSYEEIPIAVLDHKTHILRNKDINLVKVQWSRHGQQETTWEREDKMMAKYPEFLK